MLFPLRTLLFLAFLLPATSWSETCKYLNADGHVIYSNTPSNPPKGAKKVKCFEDPAPKQEATADKPSSDTPKSGDSKRKFPKVDGETQKKRDSERRAILEQELATEQQALDKAKLDLSEQESTRSGGERNYQKFLDRVQPFRDAVANHERNIEAIQREIGNLK